MLSFKIMTQYAAKRNFLLFAYCKTNTKNNSKYVNTSEGVYWVCVSLSLPFKVKSFISDIIDPHWTFSTNWVVGKWMLVLLSVVSSSLSDIIEVQLLTFPWTSLLNNLPSVSVVNLSAKRLLLLKVLNEVIRSAKVN